MLVLNGAKFARTQAEFTESLFDPSGTCVGFYKPNAKSITLSDPQGEKIGVINSHGCLCAATKLNGRYWYSFATIKQIGQYQSYLQSVDEPRNAIHTHCGFWPKG